MRTWIRYRKIIIILGAISVLIYLLKSSRTAKHFKLVCRTDIVTGEEQCRPTCPFGYFSLPGMQKCHPWLTCADNITDVRHIGKGNIKRVTKGVWNGYEVAHAYLDSEHRRADFMQGIDHMRLLSHTGKIVQFIGACGDSYTTEFYELGSAENFDDILNRKKYQEFNTATTRLKACIGYIRGIVFLHNSPIGTRIMCSSNTPEKALTQFLVAPDLDLVLNDIDRIPEASSKYGVKANCVRGRVAQTKDTFAPEQRWPFGHKHYDLDKMPGYDERVDVWKIPSVCDILLGKERVLFRKSLSAIWRRCKQTDPNLRPSAVKVLEVFTRLLDNLQNHRNIL